MVLRIFKSNQPVNFILFPVIAILFWAKSFFSPKAFLFYPGENENLLYLPINNLLKNTAFLQVFVSVFLVIVLGFLIQQINSRYSFIRTRTMLPAPLFIFLISGFVEMHTLHPVYFGAIFLLISLFRLFSTFDQSKAYSAVFDAGFLLGIGSLFYFNLVIIFPAFFLGVGILSRDARWREYVIHFIGFVLPFVFAFCYVVLTENFLEILTVYEQNLFSLNNHFAGNKLLYGLFGFLVFLTVLGSIRIIQQYDSKKVSTRKYFSVFFLIFLFSMLGFVLVPATSIEILVISAIPVSYLVSNMLVFMKSRFWSELIFSILLAIVIFIQFNA